MNTLVHGKVGGTKNVVCKFAEWCNYKVGDVIKIGFDTQKMHFFEMPRTQKNADGAEVIVEYGKAIR